MTAAHKPTHTWEWVHSTETPDDPDSKLFKEHDQPGDLRCIECATIIPGPDYYAIVDNNRQYMTLSVEEHYKRLADALELLALKFEKPLLHTS